MVKKIKQYSEEYVYLHAFHCKYSGSQTLTQHKELSANSKPLKKWGNMS